MVKQKSCLSPHDHLLTFSALLRPLIDQGGLTGSFGENIRNDEQSKLLIGVWLVLTIVLIAGYKSAMTSSLVAPAYKNPPSTFEELADSNFKVFAVYWKDDLKLKFQSLNNNVGRRLVERAVEYKYYDDDVSF